MDILSSASESAEPAITSYLACLARKERVEQICFLLVQHAAESCSIPKNLEDVTKLPAYIQKKWLESYLEKLKSLKDKNFYKVVNLSKRWKAIKNYWVFNIKSDGHYRFQLVCKRTFSGQRN